MDFPWSLPTPGTGFQRGTPTQPLPRLYMTPAEWTAMKNEQATTAEANASNTATSGARVNPATFIDSRDFADTPASPQATDSALGIRYQTALAAADPATQVAAEQAAAEQTQQQAAAAAAARVAAQNQVLLAAGVPAGLVNTPTGAPQTPGGYGETEPSKRLAGTYAGPRELTYPGLMAPTTRVFQTSPNSFVGAGLPAAATSGAAGTPQTLSGQIAAQLMDLNHRAAAIVGSRSRSFDDQMELKRIRLQQEALGTQLNIASGHEVNMAQLGEATRAHKQGERVQYAAATANAPAYLNAATAYEIARQFGSGPLGEYQAAMRGMPFNKFLPMSPFGYAGVNPYEGVQIPSIPGFANLPTYGQ
jgi:hypothetical protein